MEREIKTWTRVFMDEGFSTIIAREKAINKVKFIHEVNRINPAINKPLKGLYS